MQKKKANKTLLFLHCFELYSDFITFSFIFRMEEKEIELNYCESKVGESKSRQKKCNLKVTINCFSFKKLIHLVVTSLFNHCKAFLYWEFGMIARGFVLFYASFVKCMTRFFIGPYYWKTRVRNFRSETDSVTKSGRFFFLNSLNKHEQDYI